MKHILENFMSEKHKKLYYEYDMIKNAEIKFQTMNNIIVKVLHKLDGKWLICCGRTPYRDKTISDVYEFLKEKNVDRIIEGGIGCGGILDFIPSLNTTIVELNTNLYEHFYQICKSKNIELLNDDIWKYVEQNEFDDCAIIIRLTCMGFDSLEEYKTRIKKLFKNNFDKNNVFVFECKNIDFEIPHLIKKFTNVMSNTYVVELKNFE